ncbi:MULTISPECIES: heme exporter protein CcmD [Marinobacter]|uniref:Heme exporter protein D n=1 Tax=Marinobacter xiaoshiensis TaxID=3073652 RepID=A0ABU2HG71_9GAMM|nr:MULTISPECIES: heme exporter protein CcmD [unclassified Marinobacter]MBK1885552.1 heme exporter protein CcmD [Marinobacter sp. DY40_1A1]MDS1309596.1 heme exporter protein CcmD [Marinobacter sp. F60267]
MAFDSFSAFISMEGHGPYVWACYAVFFVLMAVMMVGSVRSRTAVIESCRRGYEFQADKGKVATASTSSASFARVNVSQD